MSDESAESNPSGSPDGDVRDGDADGDPDDRGGPTSENNSPLRNAYAALQAMLGHQPGGEEQDER